MSHLDACDLCPHAHVILSRRPTRNDLVINGRDAARRLSVSNRYRQLTSPVNTTSEGHALIEEQQIQQKVC
jgi:hypothetical protein